MKNNYNHIFLIKDYVEEVKPYVKTLISNFVSFYGVEKEISLNDLAKHELYAFCSLLIKNEILIPTAIDENKQIDSKNALIEAIKTNLSTDMINYFQLQRSYLLDLYSLTMSIILQEEHQDYVQHQKEFFSNTSED